MDYFSCNAESAIAICDSYNWDLRKRDKIKYKKIIKIREFSLLELTAATNSFSAECFLGKGSHGSVYKAVLDGGKLTAAVKKTTFFNRPSVINCTNGSTSPGENEIEILSRVQNPRLVNLIGFCVDSKKNSKLLVVEYMPNGSLYDLLHTASRPPRWTRRVRFALQVAKAIQTLHSSKPPVIHRDVKSSNVLIDGNYNARLSDFGLALRGHVEDVKIKCTPPAGTLGYLDPGYLAPGDLSTKSDVFSFGILLLEIISGRNAIDLNYSPPSVVDWALPRIKYGDFTGICDYRIGPPSDPSVVRKLSVLAAQCVRSSAEKRPEISEVVEHLRSVRKRVESRRIWSNIKRRVRCVEKSGRQRQRQLQQVIEIKREVFDASEEVVKTSSSSSRRNRRVSSVTSGDYGRIVGDRVMRSKSIGSVGEIKMGADHQIALLRRKPEVAVMRLNKSRSMGTGRLVRCNNNKGYVFEFGRSDVSKSDKKLLEKPIVFSSLV